MQRKPFVVVVLALIDGHGESQFHWDSILAIVTFKFENRFPDMSFRPQGGISEFRFHNNSEEFHLWDRHR